MPAMTSIDQIILPNEPTLVSQAHEHCILPLVHRADMQEDEPFIYAEGSGASLSDIHGNVYLDMMSAGSRASSSAMATRKSRGRCMSKRGAPITSAPPARSRDR